MRPILEKLGLFCLSLTSIVIGLAIGEIGLRAYLSSRYSYTPTRVINHRILGYYFRPNHQFSDKANDGTDHDFKTDDLGIVLRDSLNVQSDLTVMFIGDSMLEGALVLPNQNLSELLASTIKAGCQCINLGISGHSPARYMLTYRHFKQFFDPEYVFAFFYVLNDFNDDARLYHDGRIVLSKDGTTERIKPKFNYDRNVIWTLAGGSAAIELRQYWQEELGSIVVHIIKHFVMRVVDKLSGKQNYGLSPSLEPRLSQWDSKHQDRVRNNVMSVFKDRYSQDDWEDIRRTQSFLLELNQEVTDDAKKLIVVLMPFAGQIEGQIVGAEESYGIKEGEFVSTKPQAVMSSFLAEHNIPFIDLLSVLQEHKQQELFGRTDKHLSVDGHQVVAEELYRFMAEEGY